MRSRLLAVALTGLAAGCAQSPTVPKIRDQPLTLSMQFSTKTLQLGNPDTINVTLTNTFDQTARLYFDSDCKILLTIRSRAGAVVVPPNGTRNCVTKFDSLDVPAMGNVVRRFIWTGTNNFTPPGSTTPLPAGSYYVSASVSALNYSTVAPAVVVELLTP